MGCPRRRFPPSLPRVDASIDIVLLVEVLGCCVRLWCYSKPESVSRHSRDFAQLGLQEPSGEPSDCHLREPAHWNSV